MQYLIGFVIALFIAPKIDMLEVPTVAWTSSRKRRAGIKFAEMGPFSITGVAGAALRAGVTRQIVPALV